MQQEAKGGERQASLEKLARARGAFQRKVPARVKALMAVVLVAVFLFSFFAGTYSLAQGYSLGEMLDAVGEHVAAYFYLWGKFLQDPASAAVAGSAAASAASAGGPAALPGAADAALAQQIAELTAANSR